MELIDYFEAIEYPIEVKFRMKMASWVTERFYATTNAWVLEGSVLVGTTGNGKTADEALIDFAKRWSNKTIKVGSDYKKTPQLEHTKLFNV